jgi:hypothetical protein
VPRLAIGVSTADCGPLLFADGAAGVIGAAHAGWRGALTGVIEATIAAMERLGAKRDRISVALGPTIRQQNYEVGPEFVERFQTADRTNANFFAPSQRDGHAMLISRAISHNALNEPASHGSRISACARLPSRRVSSATGAPRCTASPTTVGMSMPLCLPRDVLRLDSPPRLPLGFVQAEETKQKHQAGRGCRWSGVQVAVRPASCGALAASAVC